MSNIETDWLELTKRYIKVLSDEDLIDVSKKLYIEPVQRSCFLMVLEELERRSNEKENERLKRR